MKKSTLEEMAAMQSKDNFKKSIIITFWELEVHIVSINKNRNLYKANIKRKQKDHGNLKHEKSTEM